MRDTTPSPDELPPETTADPPRRSAKAGHSSTSPQTGEVFRRGDAAIRTKLEQIAARRGTLHEGIELTDDHVYQLRGTSLSIAFRAKDIRSAADPKTFARRIAPRLEAMFEELWWRQAVTIMAGETAENLRRSK